MFRFVFERNRTDMSNIAERETEAIQVPNAVGQQCTICLENIAESSTVIKLHCDHIFHASCVLQWLSEHNTCPLCRDAQANNPTVVETTLQMPIGHIVGLQTVYLTLRYSNNLHQTTMWNMQHTIVDIMQYVQRCCEGQNAHICLRIGNLLFKTTESYNYLNQTLASFNILGEMDVDVSLF